MVTRARPVILGRRSQLDLIGQAILELSLAFDRVERLSALAGRPGEVLLEFVAEFRLDVGGVECQEWLVVRSCRGKLSVGQHARESERSHEEEDDPHRFPY